MPPQDKLRELLPGGIDDTSAGRIGLFVTKVRGDEDDGQIDDVEVVAVAYDDRAHGAEDDVTLEVRNEDGDLINESMDTGHALSRTDVFLDKGYERVILNAGKGRIPLPENGRYVLTWGGDPVGEFNRAELFSRILSPLEYAATEQLTHTIALENAQDLSDDDRDAVDVTGTTKPNPPAPDVGDEEFTPDDEDLRADANNTGGVNLGVFGTIGRTLLERFR